MSSNIIHPYIINAGATNTYASAKTMKTGQTTSYRTGDDGDIEAGREDSFFVLKSNNIFGNTNRFTDELGGQTYTNNIVIDWSTFDGSSVLGWDRRYNGGNANTDKTWNQSIDEALLHSNSGFINGWRLPNYKEIANILNLESPSFNYAPFNIGGNGFWCSSTLKLATLYAYRIGGNDCQFIYSAKTSSIGLRWLAVRNFMVTGTTLT